MFIDAKPTHRHATRQTCMHACLPQVQGESCTRPTTTPRKTACNGHNTTRGRQTTALLAPCQVDKQPTVPVLLFVRSTTLQNSTLNPEPTSSTAAISTATAAPSPILHHNTHFTAASRAQRCTAALLRFGVAPPPCSPAASRLLPAALPLRFSPPRATTPATGSCCATGRLLLLLPPMLLLSAAL